MDEQEQLESFPERNFLSSDIFSEMTFAVKIIIMVLIEVRWLPPVPLEEAAN